MARIKSGKLTAWQKLLTVMISGKQISVEEIEQTLGKEIYMYRLSTYVYDIKSYGNGVIKVIKDGRKVVAYQLINVDEMKEYMKRAGIASASFVPSQNAKKPSISKLAKLADLGAKPVPKKAKSKVEVEVVVPSNAAIETGTDEIVVTEVTEV